MMTLKTLSIFVDESGKFQHPDSTSRFYVLGMVFHNQDQNIDEIVRAMDVGVTRLGFDADRFACHAGPLIRAEKDFAMMSRSFRGKIFHQMMSFARNAPFRYHCFHVDKKFIDHVGQIVDGLRKQITEFMSSNRQLIEGVETVKVYYDCGQSPLTNLLHEALEKSITCQIEFKQGVKPNRYKFFQLADLLCTIELAALKLEKGDGLSNSEYAFFGGIRAFKHNILRYLKVKEI